MDIVIVSDKITIDELKEVAREYYGSVIKGVVDIEKEIVAFGGEYHIQANMRLVENGSEQKNIWGFNIYFDQTRDSWIEYMSLINIRPIVGNRNMEVQDKDIKEKMKLIINSKII